MILLAFSTGWVAIKASHAGIIKEHVHGALSYTLELIRIRIVLPELAILAVHALVIIIAFFAAW
jgi:hypothetical protein